MKTKAKPKKALKKTAKAGINKALDIADKQKNLKTLKIKMKFGAK